MEGTKIEWTDHTFNPWIGCTKVGPGCDHCYAERQDGHRKWTPEGWGPGKPRRRTSAANWKKPIVWNAKAFYECGSCRWRGFDAVLVGNLACGLTDGIPSCPNCDSLDVAEARPRVFCASLADVFDNEVDPAWREDLFELIRATPNLDWLLLTKRIGNAPSMLPAETPRNIWLGATVVNQEEADRDIPKLLSTPARVKFLSMEPLLGPVDLGFLEPCDHKRRSHEEVGCWMALDWIIAGGESGPKARPMQADWVRSLRDQCAAARVPFLFKQWGESAPNWLNDNGGTKIPESEWMDRVGKIIAGRELDGRKYSEFPEPKGEANV